MALLKEVGDQGGKTKPEELFAAESDVRVR